jgi:hypothetical protein
MGQAARRVATSSLHLIDGVPAMPQPNDLSRSLVAVDQNSTIIAVGNRAITSATKSQACCA